MGFAIFMTSLVSMCMLRPTEEPEEMGLYDDVGASLEPVKEKFAVNHAITPKVYNLSGEIL